MASRPIRVVSLWLLASCLVAGCGTTPIGREGVPFRDDLVVPNQRIGPAVLGMTESQMVAWLGRPDETVGSGDGAYRYRREGLQIAFGQGGAYLVAVTKPGFVTKDGISVGSAESEVRAKWGAPRKSHAPGRCIEAACQETGAETVQYCFRNGMQVEVDALSRKVTLLQVGTRGCSLH